MKKLITLWIYKGTLNVRLPSLVIKQLSGFLLVLRSNIPCEFARKPRSLSELSRFKATEFRQLLIYTGQVVFKPFLSEDCFNHFMALNIAMVILLSTNMNEYIDYARNLLEYFVKNFEIIYGKHLVSHNVHGLLHIVDDYENFGPLDNISAFPFENFMKNIKKKLRKHELPLQQLVKRFHEEFNQAKEYKIGQKNTCSKQLYFKKEHTNGPLLTNLIGPQYSTVHLKDMIIKTTKAADCYVLTIRNDVVKVINVAHVKDINIAVLIGKTFLSKKPYYEQPINSEVFNIYEVDNLSEHMCIIHFEELKKKIMLVDTLDKKKIAIPIIHTNLCDV